jgi:hypothetical protein
MRSPLQLLLPLLRAGLHREQPPLPLELQGGEWEEVAALAERSALSFQLLQAVGPSANDVLPSDWLKKLVAQIRHTAVRNVLQLRHLQQLLDACEREGIPVMLAKGLWLVHCIHRDTAARDSGDIDLLFRPQDMPRFTRLAQALGFEVPPDGASLSAHAQSTNEYALRHPESGLLVDVHWSLTNPSREAPVDEPLLWERSELVALGGVPCRTLNLEDHLLYLCFHAAVHHKFWGVGPRCLHDVAMVIHQPPRPVRWDELVARARALGWERAAWLMFALVEEHLGVRVPVAVMQGLHRESPADDAVRLAALEAIFAALEQKSLYRHLAHLLSPQPWAARRAALRRLLLPSRVQMTNQFGLSPAAPTWLLHVKRWTLKLRDWTPEVGALLLGSKAQRDELERTRQIERWLAGT